MRRRLKSIGWQTFAPPFYWGCTYLLRGLLRVVVRWDVTGRENVPMSGAVIVVSNHLNNADPPILGAGIARRRIRFMAKVELFKMPFGAIIKLWDAFPVRRFDADLAAMLNAERILKRGGVLGMFPEGHRSRTGYMGPVHPGTAMIALRYSEANDFSMSALMAAGLALFLLTMFINFSASTIIARSRSGAESEV